MSPGRNAGITNEMPYFFLSYARIPKQDPSDSNDPNAWIHKLYADLCADILQLTDARGSAGFIDRETRLGDGWPEQLAEALSSCRVFVPLYSPRYFRSEDCGKEWFVFARRVLNQRATRNSAAVGAIVPALWVTVNPDSLPEVARDIQFDNPDLGARYKAEGFYGIMKLSRYRDDYKQAVWALARRIVEVADQARIPREEPPPDYRNVESAFGAHHLHPSRHQVRITVVAPDIGTLPNGRSPDYYGSKPRGWRPYYPDYEQPLADYAAGLVTSCLGCHTAVTMLDAQGAGPGIDGASEAPGLFLIDAWTTKSPKHRLSLRRIDALAEEWVSIMVPWSSQDAQMGDAQKSLRDGLSRYLGRKITAVPGKCQMAADGIPTLPEFGDLLPKIVMTMLRRFLKVADAYPPPGGPIERPRLNPPDPENPGGTR